jgi:PAS domain-containing protein
LIDITERVAAETHLLETQKWLVTTLNSLSEAVLAADPLGTVKFINGTAQELLEWPAAEAVGRDLGDLLGRGSEIQQTGTSRRCTISDILDTSLFQLLKGSMLLKSRYGKETAVEITSAPILLDKDHVAGVVIVLRSA